MGGKRILGGPRLLPLSLSSRVPRGLSAYFAQLPRPSYANAADEVAYFAAHQPAYLGPGLARGRLIATSLCSGCHGAALDGVGEPGGNIQGALAYDDAAFNKLLIDSIDRSGKRVLVEEWGAGHEFQPLTAAERRDVIAYVRALARSRAQ